MTYAKRWRQSWCIMMVAGVGLATLEWSPTVVVMAVALSSACAAVGFIMLETARDRPDTALAPQWRRRLGRRALLIGSGVVAVSAITTASPPLALLTALLAGLTSPFVVHRMRPGAWQGTSGRELRRRPGTQERISADGLPRTDLQGRSEILGRSVKELNDRELCSLWRRTFWELQNQRTLHEVLSLVAFRQSCLDELERRNPLALQAWFASGARASGGPERFWIPHPGNADAA